MTPNFLPPLFKKTSTGAIQRWEIWTVDNLITTRWGQVDGEVQETEEVIRSGKNVGRSNETTPAQQAAAEAQSSWEKKLKRGYVQSYDDASAGKTDAIIEGGVFPMLAKSYDKDGAKISFPAFAQPKFDGHRCIAVVDEGAASLWSRTRKPITGLPHLIEALEKLSKSIGVEDFILDGELYNHDYRANFEDLTSFIRTPEAKPGHEVVQYHVYDLAVGDCSYEGRKSILDGYRLSSPLVQVETIRVADEDELMLAFERFTSQGYEGCMVRNVQGLYVNKRSADLQKIKEFQDEEFVVIAVNEGRGKLAGHAIFSCAIDPLKPYDLKTRENCFDVKLKGETSYLKTLFENEHLALDRELTVKFQGWTADHKPRFPVGLRFKEGL